MASIWRLRKHGPRDNEAGFTLAEVIIYAALSLLIMTMAGAAVISAENARTVSQVKYTLIDNSSLLNAERTTSLFNERGQLIPPKDLTFVSEACEEPTQLIASVSLSVSTEVCLKVVGTTESFVITAYAITQGNPTVFIYESDADYIGTDGTLHTNTPPTA